MTARAALMYFSGVYHSMREPGKGGGRGKKKPPAPTTGGFASHTVAHYRKISDNADKIDESGASGLGEDASLAHSNCLK
ncbi:MAG: hypothetical protein KKE86_14300 [Planctomycetes bacterium]|nr:hypothetical protein [Planctomycetota bacterium]MCG2683732.1 hypothetical protein [Planctomycetales bacterium]